MHSHKTCKYQSDGIVFPSLLGNQKLAKELVQDALSRKIIVKGVTKDVSIFARLVSSVSGSFTEEFMKLLQDNGVEHICVRGSNEELLRQLQKYSQGISVVAHIKEN